MKVSRQELLEWALLVAGTVLAVFSSRRDFPQLALLVLLVAFAVRVSRTGKYLPGTGLEVAWLLFLGSAAVGAWISIYPRLALEQFSRLFAAFVLFCALVESGYRMKRHVAWTLVIIGGGLAVYWPLTHEFASDPGKIPPLRAVGLLVNRLLPDVPGMGFSSNVVGGVLAVLLPFAVAQAWIANRHGKHRQSLFAILMGVSMLGGLLLTSSRGALLGLAAAGGMAFLVSLQLRRQPKDPGKTKFWITVLGVLLLGAVLLAWSGLLEILVGSVPDPTGSLQSRMQIWRQGWSLIGDYIFTGAGLRSFPLVFSIYRLLIHVPYHEHMHNIFLETWFEQGMLGAIAMLWGAVVVGVWAWHGLSILADPPKKSSFSLRALGWAGMAGFFATGVHGMVDVIFYTKRTMPLLGLVIGFAYLVSRPGLPQTAEKKRDSERVRRYALFGSLAAVILGLVFVRPLLSAGFANYGALAQTQIEMSLYNPNFYDEPSLDTIRRRSDLSRVEAAYHRAFDFNPSNRTALQRQAEIALGRGEFERAKEILESARNAGLDDEVTRLLYGDALVATGQPEQAAQTVKGIGWAGERLMFQAWYRYWLKEDYLRAEDVYKAILILEPGNAEAQHWLEQAQVHLK